MRYKFYTTSEKAWDAMLDAIAGARESIYIEMYIFVDNTSTHDFFAAIRKKAEEGVRVRIIIDSFGSSGLSRDSMEALRESGSELILFSHWLRYTHKKIMIIDEKTVFLGGVNIHRRFRKWNDLQVRLTGHVVKSVMRSFASTYRMCGGKDPLVLGHCKSGFLGKARIRFLEQRPGGRTLIKKHYMDRIANAEKKIVIVTPYFFPRRWLSSLLHQAVLRGVDVRVVLPRKTNHWIVNKTNWYYMATHFRVGIKFLLQNEMNHAKVMLVDDKDGVVGSQNIDILSFDYAIEAGVFFQDEDMIADLKGIIDRWQRDSVPFDLSMHRQRWLDYIIAPVIRMVQSVI